MFVEPGRDNIPCTAIVMSRPEKLKARSCSVWVIWKLSVFRYPGVWVYIWLSGWRHIQPRAYLGNMHTFIEDCMPLWKGLRVQQLAMWKTKGTTTSRDHLGFWELLQCCRLLRWLLNLDLIRLLRLLLLNWRLIFFDLDEMSLLWNCLRAEEMTSHLSTVKRCRCLATRKCPYSAPCRIFYEIEEENVAMNLVCLRKADMISAAHHEPDKDNLPWPVRKQEYLE